MGDTKYAIRDPDFYIKMRGAHWDDESRGVAVILELTGMHPISLTELSPESLRKEGPDRVLYWRRPKTNITLQRSIPKKDVEIVEKFLVLRRKSYWHYWNLVRKLGQKAGYDALSPMTYRHQRCYTLMRNGAHPMEITHIMGCSLRVANRNYAKMKEWKDLD